MSYFPHSPATNYWIKTRIHESPRDGKAKDINHDLYTWSQKIHYKTNNKWNKAEEKDSMKIEHIGDGATARTWRHIPLLEGNGPFLGYNLVSMVTDDAEDFKVEVGGNHKAEYDD
jgi:hypothetical protein